MQFDVWGNKSDQGYVVTHITGENYVQRSTNINR